MAGKEVQRYQPPPPNPYQVAAILGRFILSERAPQWDEVDHRSGQRTTRSVHYISDTEYIVTEEVDSYQEGHWTRTRREY
jgi:hypothetical protein